MTNVPIYIIMRNMKREEALNGYKIVDYRLPRKGETVLKCDNHNNYSVGKVSSNHKILFAHILKKKNERV